MIAASGYNRLRRLHPIILAAVLAVAGGAGPASGQTPPALTAVQPAADGIFQAFGTHSLVGLADNHGNAQELDFYAALIRDPRFARDVGHVVVEFGSAAQQATIDRYVDGEPVAYPELRKVWMDAVGFAPYGATYTGIANFFAQVRAVNAALPPGRKIRVWLGDPAVDWGKIKSEADLLPLRQQRDSYPAGIINREILGRGRKALVIYGGGHLSPKVLDGRAKPDARSDDIMREAAARPNPLSSSVYGTFKSYAYAGRTADGADVYAVVYERGTARSVVTPQGNVDPFDQPNVGPSTLRDEVEAAHPGAFFLATPYAGADLRCVEMFEKAAGDWPIPALWRSSGSDLERDLVNSKCGWEPLKPGWTMLYLGRWSSLTLSPRLPETWLDLELRQAMLERAALLAGRPASSNPPPAKAQPTGPMYYTPGPGRLTAAVEGR